MSQTPHFLSSKQSERIFGKYPLLTAERYISHKSILKYQDQQEFCISANISTSKQCMRINNKPCLSSFHSPLWSRNLLKNQDLRETYYIDFSLHGEIIAV